MGFTTGCLLRWGVSPTYNFSVAWQMASVPPPLMSPYLQWSPDPGRSHLLSFNTFPYS